MQYARLQLYESPRTGSCEKLRREGGVAALHMGTKMMLRNALSHCKAQKRDRRECNQDSFVQLENRISKILFGHPLPSSVKQSCSKAQPYSGEYDSATIHLSGIETSR